MHLELAPARILDADATHVTLHKPAPLLPRTIRRCAMSPEWMIVQPSGERQCVVQRHDPVHSSGAAIPTQFERRKVLPVLVRPACQRPRMLFVRLARREGRPSRHDGRISSKAGPS
jgi:hypothetical protein